MKIETAVGGQGPFWGALDDLAPLGYVEAEFLVSGEARGQPSLDAAESTEPFTTRVLVRRPADPALD